MRNFVFKLLRWVEELQSSVIPLMISAQIVGAIFSLCSYPLSMSLFTFQLPNLLLTFISLTFIGAAQSFGQWLVIKKNITNTKYWIAGSALATFIIFIPQRNFLMNNFAYRWEWLIQVSQNSFTDEQSTFALGFFVGLASGVILAFIQSFWLHQKKLFWIFISTIFSALAWSLIVGFYNPI